MTQRATKVSLSIASLKKLTKKYFQGKLRVDTVNVEKRERRVNYQFGRGYKLGRHSDEVARFGLFYLLKY